MPDILEVFESFKTANDERLKQIEDKGFSDPLLEAKVDTINAALDVAVAENKKMVEDLEAKFNNIGLNGVLLTDDEKAAQEYSNAFAGFMRKGAINDALSTGSDPDGGYAVPIEVDKNIMQLERDAVTMRRLATVESLSTEDFTKIVNVGGVNSGWVGETDSRPETDTPTLKVIKPSWGELYANPAVTQKMLDDAFFSIEGWLSRELSMEFADRENEKFLTGDGTVSPRGILDYTLALTADSARAFGSLQYVKTGKAADFIAPTATASPADCLIDIQQSLQTAFRGNAKWLMNSATVGVVRKFKDYANGAYIWQPGIKEGEPNTLLGKAIEEDENMADVGAGALSVLYGDFKRGYTICDRIGTRVLRDPFTNKPYVHFYTTKRVGGFVTDSNALKVLKVSA